MVNLVLVVEICREFSVLASNGLNTKICPSARVSSEENDILRVTLPRNSLVTTFPHIYCWNNSDLDVVLDGRLEVHVTVEAIVDAGIESWAEESFFVTVGDRTYGHSIPRKLASSASDTSKGAETDWRPRRIFRTT